jgi:hypothetical protein
MVTLASLSRAGGNDHQLRVIQYGQSPPQRRVLPETHAEDKMSASLTAEHM